MTYEQVILERAQHDYEGVDDYLLNMKKSGSSVVSVGEIPA